MFAVAKLQGDACVVLSGKKKERNRKKLRAMRCDNVNYGPTDDTDTPSDREIMCDAKRQCGLWTNGRTDTPSDRNAKIHLKFSYL